MFLAKIFLFLVLIIVVYLRHFLRQRIIYVIAFKHVKDRDSTKNSNLSLCPLKFLNDKRMFVTRNSRKAVCFYVAFNSTKIIKKKLNREFFDAHLMFLTLYKFNINQYLASFFSLQSRFETVRHIADK